MAAYAPLIGFDAAYEGSVGDGNALTSVSDQSGNGNTIAATSTGPIWRADARGTGLAGIEFAGTSASTLGADGATAVKASAVGDLSCTFVVACIYDSVSARQGLLCIADSTAPSPGFGARLALGQFPSLNSPYTYLQGDSGGLVQRISAANPSTATVHIVSYRVDGSANTCDWRLDGVADTPQAFAATDTMVAPDLVTFGARRMNTGENSQFDGIIHQAWYWGTALSDATLDDVEDLVNSTVGVY